jgi:hypothetical protein
MWLFHAAGAARGRVVEPSVLRRTAGRTAPASSATPRGIAIRADADELTERWDSPFSFLTRRMTRAPTQLCG